MAKPPPTKGSDEELRLLEGIGLIPPSVSTDALAVLRERAAAGPVYRWECRGRVRLLVFDPVLAAETACPRVQALAVPPSRDTRERRWASSFLVEAAHGGGPRTARLTEAAQNAWNDPRQIQARQELHARFLARYKPGLLRPLGRDLREHALHVAVLWTEGRGDGEATRILEAATGGGEAAAQHYRRRLAAIPDAGTGCGVLAGLSEAGPEALVDAALFAELVARVLGDLLVAMGRVLCDGEGRGDSGNAALLERVLHDDPPWWIHVRETVHEYRLGIHRLPPGTRIFVPVPLLAEGGSVPTVAVGHPRALALGANLCPPLRLLPDHARHLGGGLAAVGRLEPVVSVRFAGADGRFAPDTMGVHLR